MSKVWDLDAMKKWNVEEYREQETQEDSETNWKKKYQDLATSSVKTLDIFTELKQQSKKDSKKLKQITGILKRQLRASGMIHEINDVLNKD